MKLLLITIKREERNSGTRYIYPSKGWDSSKVLFGPFYENIKKGSGKIKEEIICGINDKDLDFFLTANGVEENDHTFLVRELTYDEAIAIGEIRMPAIEKVSNNESVLLSMSRILRGDHTDQDIKVLDPNNPVPGINRTPSFKEILDKRLEIK